MIIGDQRYFTCNVDIDMVMNDTLNGDPQNPPLISKDKIEQDLNNNYDKAMRELYNKFDSDRYEGQILTRREIRQHTYPRVPLLLNDTGLRIFGCGWDSARFNDNSVIVWAEFIQDEKKGWTMHVHNVVSLVDVKTKSKIPMSFPDQVSEFKKMLIGYNGNSFGKLDYENIKVMVCDAGSGGLFIVFNILGIK